MAIEIATPKPTDIFLLQAAHADSMVYNFRTRKDLIGNNYPELKDAKIDTLLFHTWRVRNLRAALWEQLENQPLPEPKPEPVVHEIVKVNKLMDELRAEIKKNAQ